MKIREAVSEDMPQLIELAEKHGLSIPKEGTIVVAESNSGKIEAFANIRFVAMLEPVVIENPLIGAKLWNYVAEESRKKGIKILRCFAQEKHVKLLKKLGFYSVFKKSRPMEINFY
jgi:hypothetical protein